MKRKTSGGKMTRWEAVGDCGSKHDGIGQAEIAGPINRDMGGQRKFGFVGRDENDGGGLTNEAGEDGMITSHEASCPGGNGMVHLGKMGVNGRKTARHVDVLTGKGTREHVVGSEIGGGEMEIAYEVDADS